MNYFAFILLLLVFFVIVMPIIAVTKAADAKRIAEDFAFRIRGLEAAIRRLESQLEPERKSAPAAAAKEPVAAAVPLVQAPPRFPPPSPIDLTKSSGKPAPASPPPFTAPLVSPAPKPEPTILPPSIFAEPEPAFRKLLPPLPPRPALNLEQFMGGKMLAWIGGLALFLGVAFFVKYSFEHNLISPAMRAAIGYVVGAGLIIGGLGVRKRDIAVTAQTLCATGILVLYAVTYACRVFYHFPFFEVVPTFTLMALTTALAFILAVRMDALVVAILGLAGGFLTPILLSTGQDVPLALFGYIGLLDFGLLAVALRKRWPSLPALGALGTILTQIGWVSAFFVSEHYAADNKVFIALSVFAGLFALFLAAVTIAKKFARSSDSLSLSALALGISALLFAFFLLGFPSLTARPAIIFGYLLLIDLGLFALALLIGKFAEMEGWLGVSVFALLAAWTVYHLTPAHLGISLTSYFVFALLHSVAPLVLQRRRAATPSPWRHVFPAIALGFALVPILVFSEPSLSIWAFVLLVDVLAIGIAVLGLTSTPILVALLLTLITTGAWLSHIPPSLDGLPTGLALIGGFAIFFFAVAIWVSRRFQPAGQTRGQNLADYLPIFSATLPFLLLIMLTLRLPLVNPAPVFGLALLLAALLLGLARCFSFFTLPGVALGAVFLLEFTWHGCHFHPANPRPALAWYLGFYALFTVFPFLFHRRFADRPEPWSASAASGPAHFLLVYLLVKAAWPNGGAMGLLPAAFAVPSLLGLVVLLRRTPAASPARMSQLAWFGGVALLFITLIFPIQFHREWLTISWALEGAALCWLFRRVPHPGLRLTALGLLLTAFTRLALNSKVLEYHARADAPILNWYLYAYGVAAVAFFAAARLLAPPRNRIGEFDAPPLFYTLGTVLLFLLVNIEIADFFSVLGAPVLTFEFFGNFARDMTYSIAWALFALVLLVIGIRQKVALVRYASLGLLGLTVAKLFLHDLSQLDQLYRIGAFIAVAIIAILASFLYQRFVILLQDDEAS